jgi:hypothetical protein
MTSPSRISYSTRPMPWMPTASRRMPSSGGSAISASAIRLLVVGSQPGNSMPAALRTTLRPPSQPTRYSAAATRLGELHVDAGGVLREARHLTAAVDRHRQLVDPAGQDALDVLLPQREPVGVAGGEVADVQLHAGEAGGLADPALGEEPIGDPALVRAPRSCARADRRRGAEQLPVGSPLDERDVDARERQLARQHHSRRAASGDDH